MRDSKSLRPIVERVGTAETHDNGLALLCLLSAFCSRDHQRSSVRGSRPWNKVTPLFDFADFLCSLLDCSGDRNFDSGKCNTHDLGDDDAIGGCCCSDDGDPDFDNDEISTSSDSRRRARNFGQYERDDDAADEADGNDDEEDNGKLDVSDAVRR